MYEAREKQWEERIYDIENSYGQVEYQWKEDKDKYFREIRFRTGDKSAKEYANDRKITRTFEDVTEEWFRKATPNSHEVIRLNEIEIDGVVYKVDGVNVILDTKPYEFKVAELIKNTFGGKIAVRPRVVNPNGIQSADFEIWGEKYDLKTVIGSSKHTLYGMVKDKERQACNFIYDISNTQMSVDEAIYQIENDVYRSRHTRFVKNVMLIKNNEIIKVYKRN